MADDFDLSQFITGSLCLRENTAPAIKPVHPGKDLFSSFWNEDPNKVLGIVPFSEQKKVPVETIGSPIQEFYRGVNVFITGGSGFVGKVLLEKLLRSMPHIGHIYLLIREKRGKTCQERFQMLLENSIFQRLKVEVPDFRNKITALAGNMPEPGLGLSEEDRQLILDSVQVVFHCAADVRFLEPLREAVLSNVLGTKHILDLAKQIKNLKAYMHVSTAYSQCVQRVIEERVPKMSVNYKEIVHYVETNTDSHIQDNLKRILQEWPNTYTFTKAMSEDMIQEEAGDLPICIFRPSIVVNSYKEPLRGWSDSILGVGGLLLAIGLGILHHYRTDISDTIDVVPVDYVVNCMIAASWNTSRKRDNAQRPYVVNFTSFPQQVTTWKTMERLLPAVNKWPLYSQVWYPSYWLTHSYVLDEIMHLTVYKIQGAVMDKIAPLIGQKPRLTKIYAMLYSVKDALFYFTDGFWEFKNDNVLELWSSMTKEDQNMFNFHMSNFDTYKQSARSALGMRHFYLKESMDSIPAAKRKNKWLYFAHVTLKVAIGLVVLKLAVSVARVLPF